MKKFENIFTDLVLMSLKIIMLIIVIGTIQSINVMNDFMNLGMIIQIIFWGGAIIGFILLFNDEKLASKKLIIYILSVGSCIRVLWLINAYTVPISDFNTMYIAAEALLRGDVSAFNGIGYIARFPHLTIMTLYFATIIKFFIQPIIVIKVINIIASVISIYLIYKVCKEIFDEEKYALIGAFISAIFPPMISYVAVFATENIAIPFYLGSIYLFIKFMKGKRKIRYLILSGTLLSIGNLFRMVAIVTLIAYVMYIVIYFKERVIKKVEIITYIVAFYAVILISVSFSLKYVGITEYNLWKGSEPAITNILKGTNIEYEGRWNLEDAAIPELCNYNYDEMVEISREIIINRFKGHSGIEWLKFYVTKLGSQWSNGDLSGIYWTNLSLDEVVMKVRIDENNKIIVQLVYLVIILLSYISLFNKKRTREKNNIINLLYIILCGYIVLYLITENQERYAYIVSWLFIIFSVSGIEKLKK